MTPPAKPSEQKRRSGGLPTVSALTTAILASLFLSFAGSAAYAQGTPACTMTAAQIPSLRVIRGSTNNLIFDTADPATSAALVAACGDTAGGFTNAYVEDNSFADPGTQLSGLNATLAGSGSTFSFGGSGRRTITYTPGPSVGATERVFYANTSTYTAVTPSGTVNGARQIRLYSSGSAAPNIWIVVTVDSPNAPTASVSVNPTSIYAGGTSVATVTLTNPNSSAALAGVADAITLPSGVTVGATPGASTTCGGTLTAVAGASTVSLSGGSLTANATCTMTFNVTPSTVATHTIPSGTPSATGANAGSAGSTATLTATTPPSPPTIAVAWDAASTLVGDTRTLTVTLTNSNAITLTGVGFNFGTVPAAFSATNLTGTCLGSSYNGGTRQLAMSGHTMSAGASCTAVLTVTATAAGAYTFTTGTSFATGPISLTGATATTGTLTVSAPPTVTSISPTAGPASGGTTVTLTGTNFTGATAVTFGAAAATGFTVNSATQITATAPAGTGTVDVRVTTAGGTSATSASDQFTYIAAPTVTSISPTAGRTSGGTTVVITGANLSGTTAVTFGATSAIGFTVNSATQITATAPAGTGTVDVRVTTAGGTSATSASDQFTYVAAPTVTSISPTAGPGSAGTTVTITGTGFAGTTAVTFGATAATGFTVNSTTQITATAPAGTGTVDVRVTTLGGTSATSASDQYTYVTAPTVTSISPTAGSTSGGTTVTITGTGFSGTTAVTFGATAATGFTVNSATQITATAPAGTGTVNVRVTTQGGTSATGAANQYSYSAPPTVTGLTPNTGGLAGGQVTITGTGFTGATGVSFGGPSIPANTYTVVSDTSITATAPATGAAGAVWVEVTTPYGLSPRAAGNVYTYVDAPLVTGVAPSSGPQTGGTSVVVTGTNFVGVSAVRFGATNAQSFVVDSPTQITAVSPTGTAGVNVIVVAVGGTSPGGPGSDFTYIAPPPAPDIALLSPNSGSTAGGTPVTIRGTGFTGATAVSFGGTPATSFAFQSDTEVIAIAPAGTGTVDVRITAAGGTSATNAADQYTFIAAPTVSSISPAEGAAHESTPPANVTITGTNFSGNGNIVTFGGMEGAIVSEGTTSIVVTPPANAAGGQVDVVVTNAALESATANNAYRYLLPPTVTVNFSPGTIAGVENTTFTVTLTNPNAVALQNVRVASDGATTPFVATGFGPTFCGSAGNYNATSAFTLSGVNLGANASCTVSPPQRGTASGTFVFVTTAPSSSGTATTAVPLTGVAATSNPIAVQLTPSISGVSPATGPQSGGTTVTLTGSNFTGVTGVTFGGVAATGVTVVSNTRLTAVAPASAVSGLVNITATNNAGTATRTNGFTYAAPPAVTSISPSSGPTVGGTTVVITGTGFTGATAVTFGATAATAYTVNGATQITATAPPGAGTVDVRVTATGGTSATSAADQFTYSTGPFINTISPNEGSATAPAAVTISGINFSASGNSVTFGGIAGSITAESVSSITVTPPARPAGGPVDVVVTNMASLSGTATNAYRYLLPPTLVATFSPSTINGSATTTFSVTITNPNAVELRNIAFGPTSMPAGFTASGNVVFGCSPGGGNLTATSISVSSVPLAANASCTLSASYTQPTSGIYSFTSGVPTATGTATTTVSLTGVAVTSNSVTVNGTPAISTVSPNSGSLLGGTAVTLTGTNFTGATAVTIGGTAATGITVVNNTTITATTPAHALGAVNVVVTTPGGVATLVNGFTYGAPTIIIAPATVPGATVGAAYSEAISASGGTAPYSYAVTAGALPDGLTLSAGGVLSGTPTAGGAFNFTVTATDAGAFTGARAYSLTVAAPTITVAPTTLPSATAGTAYSQTVTASGGTAPYTYQLTAGALPAGVSLSTAGVLSGTPTVAGTFAFTLTATDSSTGTGPFSGSRAYSLSVSAPTIALAPATLPVADVATAYSQTITASGGTAPYSYAVTAGALPAGLTLSAGGVLSGAPSAGGTFAFTVTATDANSFSAARAYSLTVSAATVTLAPPALPDGGTGDPYSQTLTASGGVAPYTYQVTAGALPAGLSLSTAGVLSGTPTSPGSFAFTVTATDSATGAGPYSGSRAYALSIADLSPGSPVIVSGPPALSNSTTATFNVTGAGLEASLDGAAFTTVTSPVVFTGLADGSHTVQFRSVTPGGTSPVTPYTWTIDATAPAAPVIGAPVDGSVTDNGTPTFTGTAEDGATVMLSINGAMPVSVTATGGIWSYTPGTALPVGPNIVSAIAVDAAGNASPASATVRFTYSPVTITTATLPSGQVGVAYAATIQASGGTGPYGFAVTSGVLPAGVVLSGGGTLSGTPTASGTFAFTVTATDANGLSTSQAYSVTVDRPADPVVTDVSDVQVTANPGGSGQPTVIDLSGAVQNAIRIEIVTPPAHGVATVNGFEVTYTPQAGYFGPDSFTYRAVGFDDGGAAIVAPGKGGSPASAVSQPATVSIIIPAPTLILTGGTQPAGQIGLAYSQVLTTSGGTAPYTYSVTGGALPAGITLATNGTLSGSPTAGGTFNFTVTATDSSTGTGPFSVAAVHALTIDAPALTVTPSALPDATTAQPYSQTFSTTGGVAPYSYAVTAGALPTGLTLSPAGVLSGTATQGGVFNFTVSATDSSTGAGPYTSAQPVTLTVTASTIAVTPASLVAGTRGTAYSATVAASGGVGPYSYTIASGALPAGLTLSPAGQISGTPTALGTFAFQVRATDSATGAGPYSGVANVTLTIGAASLTVTPTTLPDGLAGVQWSQQLQATGGQGGYGFAVTTGVLPQGLTLTPAGLISGKPTTAGTFAFTITATDGFGNTGVVELSITVVGRPDPSADPDVRGLNTAQAEAARRMVGTQLGNFGRRLEQLHRGGEGQAGAAMNLTLDGSAFTPLDQSRQSLGELGQVLGRNEDNRRDSSGRDELNRMVWSDQAGSGPTGGTSNDRANAGPQGGSNSPEPSGPRIWAGGAISLGERDATTQTAKMQITTSGISVGVDMSVADNLDLGVGVGFGQENTDVGVDRSRLEADSRVAVAYGSWRPVTDVFIDGILGYGDLGFDMRRRTPVDSSLVFGQRDGSAVFGSVSAGLDRVAGPARWISYGRVEVLNADLDAYVETGSPLWALSYEARSVESLQGALGLRYEREILRGQDRWIPGVRVEWTHEFGDGGAQSLRYADWLDGPGYSINQEGWERSRFNLGLSLGWRAADGWSWTGEYDGAFSNGEVLNGLRIKGARAF